MSGRHPSLARERARIVAVAAGLQLALAFALPPLFGRLLHLPEEQAQVVRLAFFGLVPLVSLSVSLAVAIGLRGAHASARDRQAGRRRVLLAPLAVGIAVLAAELVGVAGLTAGLFARSTPLPILVDLALGSLAILALPPVPLFVLARLVLLPLALELGDEQQVGRGRLSLALTLGYAVTSVAWAAIVPAAVFGAAELDVAAARSARSRALLAGAHLAHAAARLDVAAATRLVTRTALAGGERTLLRAASGTLLLPDDDETAAELASLPYVEVPLEGALRGATLRVAYAARPMTRAPLLAVTLLMLSLSLAVAIVTGRAVARDLRRVARQIARLAEEEEPPPIGALATFEVRRLARALNRLLERVPRFTVESFLAVEHAEEAQRLKSQFLANMSHDLRSPLNSILGFSELLLRGIEGPISDEQRKQLEHIHERGNELLRLLNEILDTAKLESGRMELHRQNAVPAELVRAALQEARRGRPQRIVDQVTVSLQPGLQPIHVDPLRLTQAVTHLLNYGIAAALGAGRKGHVILRASEETFATRNFVIELEHSRPLTKEAAARLFDGFRPDAGGLHLQLPLARRLVELHGGSLEVTDLSPARLRLLVPLGRGA